MLFEDADERILRTALRERRAHRAEWREALHEWGTVPQHDDARAAHRASLIGRANESRRRYEELTHRLDSVLLRGRGWAGGGLDGFRRRMREMGEALCEDARLCSDERTYGRWVREFLIWKDLAGLWGTQSDSMAQILLHSVVTDERVRVAWRMRDRLRTRRRREAGYWRSGRQLEKGRARKARQLDEMTPDERRAWNRRKADRRKELRAEKRALDEARSVPEAAE